MPCASALTEQREPLIACDLFTRLFEQQVRRTPDNTAIEFEDQAVTYDELNRRANLVARFLCDQGYEREDRIGICLDRSIDAIVCMLGILKSGCAFVPLDPEFPADRLGYIVEHASIRTIFCDEKYEPLYDSTKYQLLDPAGLVLENYVDSDLDFDVPPDSLAYVMYTSGSTGKPKGVQIEHQSLTTYCLADVDIYKLVGSDRTLQFSTLNFDVAIEEIYPPLLVGSTVVVRPRQRSAASIELSDLVESNSITALHIATAYWNEWIDLMMAAGVRVPKSLRLVIVTGEKISVEHFRRWQSLCDHSLLWCNAYGPTETTVTCTVFIPQDDWDAPQMPIGKPLQGYDAFILDDQLQVVPPGETGQLFIGGPALARGYLARPDLTEKAFVHVQFPGESAARRIYRTGDLARWLPSGDIEFAGRVDHQMKIGSYRIEPGEIEAILHQDPSVRESLVLCDEIHGQKYLVAYVVPMTTKPSASALAKFLRNRLPAYMVPTRYVFLESMPKTMNGKVDRKALPSSTEAEIAHDGTLQEASSELEKELASIFAKVLNVPSVGVHDDFFLLGGSSLLVTRVIAQMTHRLTCAIPVRDFFANPTVATLAQHIESITGRNRQNGDSPSSALATSRLSTKLRQQLPRIQPLAVTSQGCRLHAIHYMPNQDQAARRNHALVIVPSYGHEYARSHRNLQQLAVQLSKQGIDVVRFDFAGTGNSDGDVERLDVSQFQNDIASVVNVVRNDLKIDCISVVGIRLGASLALTTNLDRLENLYCWDPVIEGGPYLKRLKSFHQQELKNLTKYLRIRDSREDELLGYSWPSRLVRGVEEIDLARISMDSRAKAKFIGCIMTKQSPTELQTTDARALQGWTVSTAEDEILWDELAYINSAFASQNVYRYVVDHMIGVSN